MSIDQELQNWDSFYSAVAGIAGVLVGLLFVALALSPSIMKETSPSGLRVWCSQTFFSLILTLTFSLLFLLPDLSSLGLGIPVVLVSLLGLHRLWVDLRTMHRDPDPRWSHNHAGLKLFGYIIAAYLIAIGIGFSLILGRTGLIDVMVAPVFLLLTNSATNCWNILKEVADLPSP